MLLKNVPEETHDVLVESRRIEITEEMHIRACRLATDPAFRTKAPVQIWNTLKEEMDVKYSGTPWSGLQRESVMRLVGKTRNDLGLGNSIATIENTPEYSQMKDASWSFLRYSATMPVPNEEGESMRFMVFGNPELIRLLKM